MSMRGNVKRARKEGQLTFLNKAEKIIFYTFQITNSTKKYPKKWRFTLTNRIQEKALEIYHNLLHANEIYPKTQKDAERRFELQELAIVNCKELDFFG